MKTNLTWRDVDQRAMHVADYIAAHISESVFLYGVPRGGIPAALLIRQSLAMRGNGCVLVEDVKRADVFIDDIIDTGNTKNKYIEKWPGKAFFALVNKQDISDSQLGWVVFPWEKAANESEGPEENVRRLLQYIGENPDREGLKDTPRRVLASYKTLFGGYEIDPKDILTVFDQDSYDQMVVLKNIEFYSYCEHHMMPFFGKAHIAYVPGSKIVGISKLARILDIFSRRLQIQERLCQQITQALMDCLEPKGAACVLEAQHLCMTARGVSKQNSIMETSSLTGVFRDDARTRNEFLSRIGK